MRLKKTPACYMYQFAVILGIVTIALQLSYMVLQFVVKFNQ